MTRLLALWVVVVMGVIRAAGGDQNNTPTTAQKVAPSPAPSSRVNPGGSKLNPGDVVDSVPVSMCCGPDMVFNMSYMGCEPASERPVITFHYEDGRLVEYQFAFQVMVGFPNCSSYSLQPGTEPDDVFYLLPDGRLKRAIGEMFFGSDEYCLLNSGEEMGAVVCFPERSESNFDQVVYNILYPTGLVISAAFLCLTLVVYCLVGELRDLLGKSLMCSIAALAVAKVSTVIVQLATPTLPPAACILMGVMMHFWYLAAFLWLNVISFNVCLTIWRKNDFPLGSARQWFLVYNLYAWGLSALICLLAIARDFSVQMNDSAIPKPEFGLVKCWFSDDNAVVLFFYAPICVILGLNVVLFCASAYKLYTLNKNMEARVFQFSLYCKLFVLMGVTWIFEAISFFVERETKSPNTGYIWILFDFINIMQGFIIFVVFVCRRAVLIRVCEVVCGQTCTRAKFPVYYQNAEADLPPNEAKHTVI